MARGMHFLNDNAVAAGRKMVTSLEQQDCLQHFAGGLTKTQLRMLEELGDTKNFEDGELILIAGERSKKFYLLLSGSACVEMATDFCAISVQILAEGDAFGWSSLLDHYQALFQVRARESCSAICLDGEAVTALCKRDPILGVKLLLEALRTAAGRIQGLEVRLAEFCGFSRPAD